jgi:hypothetical protein
MTPTDLCCLLAERDIKLSIRLVVDAPAGAVTEELRAALVEQKPALVHHLAREALWAHLSTWRWGEPTDEKEPPNVLADEPPLE